MPIDPEGREFPPRARGRIARGGSAAESTAARGVTRPMVRRAAREDALQPLIEVRRYPGDTVHHRHDFHQLVLPLEGRLDLVVEGRPGTVSDDCVAVVPAGHEHGFAGSKVNAFLVIDLAVDSPLATALPAALLWDRARREPFVVLGTEQHLLVAYLARATQRGQIRGPMAAHGCALLLGTLCAELGLDAQGRWPRGLQAVCGYVDAHLEWPLPVAELARVGNVSASRLHALFREHLKTTPQRYVTGRRMQRARELLAGTALAVIEVAQRTGYGDQAAFTRAFRRHAGMTPRAWRVASTGREAGQK